MSNVGDRNFDPVRNRRFLLLVSMCSAVTLTTALAAFVVHRPTNKQPNGPVQVRSDQIGSQHVGSDVVSTVVSTGREHINAESSVPLAIEPTPIQTSVQPSSRTPIQTPSQTPIQTSTANDVTVGRQELALIAAALQQVGTTTGYDPAYVPLAYLGGDVEISTGVCSDVIVRSYRAINADLQQLLHDDMRANFSVYPTRWGLEKPDANIDHRRVPNLETFFRRHGGQLAITDRGAIINRATL